METARRSRLSLGVWMFEGRILVKIRGFGASMPSIFRTRFGILYSTDGRR